MERAELARLLGASRRRSAETRCVVEERAPAAFMAALTDAVAGHGVVMVADPNWRTAERAQFACLLAGPTRNSEPRTRNRARQRPAAGWLCLPTGGSSGVVRLARHDQRTIAAAALGFGPHFGVERVNAIGVLPLHHVSGLMAWMRCAFTGGRYVPWLWDELETGRWPRLGAGDWFLSLVPTQLQRLLRRRDAADRLRRYRAVLLGGGPAWPALLERAADARLPLAPGYGSTETAAMVTSLRPEEFLAGRRGSGPALPHARVTVDAAGVIRVAGRSLFRGYFPRWRPAGAWTTDDRGRFDEHGSLHVLGRRDAIIITGGKKVDPHEVESVLRGTGAFGEVAVIGLPDAEWGEVVTACYPGGGARPDLAAVRAAVARELAPHKRPKRFVALATWPRNAQGKLNRPALSALVSAGADAGGRRLA